MRGVVSGEKRAESTMKTPGVDFSGTADTMWEGDVLMARDRSEDGRRCKNTVRRSRRIAKEEI